MDTMAAVVLTDHVVSVSELKSNPKKALSSGNGAPVAVLNHNKPEFYCVPPELFELLADVLEDLQLAQIVRDRANAKRVKVTLNEL